MEELIPTHSIVYRLHKDNSPVVVDYYSEEEQREQLAIISKDYKHAQGMSPTQALKILNEFGETFKPKPVSKEETWLKWALGK
jgi:hypothetical protein